MKLKSLMGCALALSLSLNGQDFLKRSYNQLKDKAAAITSGSMQAFKQLPGALQSCLINKNCTPEQRKLLISSAKALGYTVLALATVGAAIYASKKDKRVPFDSLDKIKGQQPLLDNMVLAINKNRIIDVEKFLSQVRFNQQQLDNFLTLVVKSGEPELIALFLKYGASAKAVDIEGNSLLFWAVRRISFSNPGKQDYNLTTTIIDQLLANGAPVNAPGEGGITPLMLAADSNNSALVKKLLKHGADKNARDNEGKRAYDYAREGDLKDLLSSSIGLKGML